MERTTLPGVLYPLYLASSVAAGLAVLTPFVALVLVLAYGLGHLSIAPNLFLGFLACMMFAGALPGAIRLRQTLRIGSLKAFGATVRRLETPLRFWAWVLVFALLAAANLAVAIVFAWTAFDWSA